MLHRLHRISAVLIIAFILLHLMNHLFALVGIAEHIEFMEKLRVIYRNVVVEGLLLICILYQVGSGLHFAWARRGKRKGFFEKAQVISGLYLAYFFLNHIGAVLFGRIGLGLDTNIYYGIAGFHTNPFQYYFIPYYFLAVVAVFIHIAAAFHRLSSNALGEKQRKWIAYAIILLGVLLSNFLIDAFCGVFYDIEIPQEYSAIYSRLLTQ